MITSQKVILATDEFGKDELLDFVRKVGPRVYAVKVHSLYDLYGPEVVNEIKTAGAARVWVDFKLHDIPNTIRLRAKAIAESGADILSVHASGGVEMLKAAKEGFGNGKVLGITALTSLSDESLRGIYNTSGAEEIVGRLAKLVKESGIDGLVCSPKEVAMLRGYSEFNGLELVVPGIRSAGVDTNDQKRFDTPGNALKAGASFLVMGRQLTQAADAAAALDSLEQELSLVE